MNEAAPRRPRHETGGASVVRLPVRDPAAGWRLALSVIATGALFAIAVVIDPWHRRWPVALLVLLAGSVVITGLVRAEADRRHRLRDLRQRRRGP